MNALDQILFDNQAPDVTAIVCKDTQITYKDLRHRVTQACAYFKTVLSADNNRVAICAADSIEWAVAALGVMCAGGVVASASHKSPQPVIQAKIEKIDPVLVLSDQSSIQHGNCVDIVGWFNSLDQLLPADPVSVSADSHCAFFNSGGTTGAGKMLIQTHRTLLATLEHVNQQVLPMTGERSMVTAPFFAGYGSAHLFGALMNGATVVVCTSLNPNTILDLIKTHKITRFGSTPVIYSLLIKHQCKVPASTLCISASDIATEHLLTKWYQLTGRHIRNVFGTSEASTVFFVPEDKIGTIPLDSLGVLIPGQLEVQLRDENLDPVPSGEIGQIWFRGPMVNVGIWNEPDLEKQLLIDGWATTEDLMKEQDGVYYFVGRKSDVFKIDSQPVDLSSLENQCLKSNLFDDVVAVPLLSDCRTRIKILAVAETKQNEQELLQTLQKFLSSQLKRHEIPDCIELVSELPRSPAGKKIRKPQYL